MGCDLCQMFKDCIRGTHFPLLVNQVTPSSRWHHDSLVCMR